MASSRDYLSFVLDQLRLVDGVTHRKMMGEYLLYCEGKLFGGIYDDRLLVKPVDAALSLVPDGRLEEPYPGAKPMLLVDELDDCAFLATLVHAMLPELPEPGQKHAR